MFYFLRYRLMSFCLSYLYLSHRNVMFTWPSFNYLMNTIVLLFLTFPLSKPNIRSLLSCGNVGSITFLPCFCFPL